MGDHRASIKIEFEFHDETYKADWWINYFPTEVDGVDSRIIEFFRDGYKKGIAKYEMDMFKADRKRRDKQNKEDELKELARLKAKYDSNQPEKE